ncbi:MAG: hypothetical protein L0Y56_03075 [Nitrospira sp.]|nr:hypothetical protein [Nitrospira sp.]
MRWAVWYKLLLLLGFSIGLLGASGGGCGGENLFENLADDSSRQAKLEAAQLALDKGECQKAFDGFTALQTQEPTNVDLRQDLSAALMCRAGFNVAGFIKIAADFSGGAIFKRISDQAVNLVSSNWQADTTQAENLLTPYQSDADVAFSLSVVSTIKATLTVLDLINYANGIVGCTVSSPCSITAADAAAIMSNLNSAYNSLSNAGLVGTDVASTVNQIRTDLNNMSGTSTDPVTSQDVKQYLTNQGFDTTFVNAI